MVNPLIIVGWVLFAAIVTLVALLAYVFVRYYQDDYEVQSRSCGRVFWVASHLPLSTGYAAHPHMRCLPSHPCTSSPLQRTRS